MSSLPSNMTTARRLRMHRDDSRLSKGSARKSDNDFLPVIGGFRGGFSPTAGSPPSEILTQLRASLLGMHAYQQVSPEQQRVLRSEAKKRGSAQMLVNAQSVRGDDRIDERPTSAAMKTSEATSPAKKKRRKGGDAPALKPSSRESSNDENKENSSCPPLTVRRVSVRERESSAARRPHFQLFIPDKELEDFLFSLKADQRRRELYQRMTAHIAAHCEARCGVSLKAITSLHRLRYRVQINSFSAERRKFSRNARHLVTALWVYETALLLADSFPRTLEALLLQGNYHSLVRLTGPLQVFFSSPWEYFLALGRWVAFFARCAADDDEEKPAFAQEDMIKIIARYENLYISRWLVSSSSVLHEVHCRSTAEEVSVVNEALQRLLSTGGSLRSESLSVARLFPPNSAAPELPTAKFGLVLTTDDDDDEGSTTESEALGSGESVEVKPAREALLREGDGEQGEAKLTSSHDDSPAVNELPPLPSLCGEEKGERKNRCREDSISSAAEDDEFAPLMQLIAAWDH